MSFNLPRDKKWIPVDPQVESHSHSPLTLYWQTQRLRRHHIIWLTVVRIKGLLSSQYLQDPPGHSPQSSVLYDVQRHASERPGNSIYINLRFIVIFFDMRVLNWKTNSKTFHIDQKSFYCISIWSRGISIVRFTILHRFHDFVFLFVSNLEKNWILCNILISLSPASLFQACDSQWLLLGDRSI